MRNLVETWWFGLNWNQACATYVSGLSVKG